MLVLFILTYNFRTEYHRKCHSHFLLSVLSLRVLQSPQPKVNSVTKKFITRHPRTTGFWEVWVRVRVALENPRVAHDIPYLIPYSCKLKEKYLMVIDASN